MITKEEEKAETWKEYTDELYSGQIQDRDLKKKKKYKRKILVHLL